MKTPITPQGLPPYIYGWEAGPNEKVWSEAAVREALAAQAATLESIHKIIECAGPEAADEIADLLGYPSVEWPSDQAASVVPVGEVMEGAQTVGFGRKEIQKFAQFDQSLPVGTKLYASAPSPASVPEVDVPLRKVVFSVLEGFTLPQAIRKILEAAYYTPSPAAAAQAVDAVDEREAGHVGDTRFEGWLSESVHKGSMYLKQDMRDSYWAGYQERAALQAARQPQAQQGVAAPLELKVCHSQNASQTPQTGLSLMAAPQEWSPAYTRGPARQSAPVTAVPAMVPLTEEQMVSAVRPLCNTDQVAERLVAVSIDEYRAIEAASAKLNGLTVGYGAQPIKDTP